MKKKTKKNRSIGMTRAEKLQKKWHKRRITDEQLSHMAKGLLFMSKWELPDGRMMFPDGFQTQL